MKAAGTLGPNRRSQVVLVCFYKNSEPKSDPTAGRTAHFWTKPVVVLNCIVHYGMGTSDCPKATMATHCGQTFTYSTFIETFPHVNSGQSKSKHYYYYQYCGVTRNRNSKKMLLEPHVAPVLQHVSVGRASENIQPHPPPTQGPAEGLKRHWSMNVNLQCMQTMSRLHREKMLSQMPRHDW